MLHFSIIVSLKAEDEFIDAIYWYSVGTIGGVVVPSRIVHRVVENNRIRWSHCTSVKCCQEREI